MLRKKFDAAAKGDCANPVDATVELGQKLGVRATPSFFLADGRMVAGAIPREQLEARLNAAQTRSPPSREQSARPPRGTSSLVIRNSSFDPRETMQWASWTSSRKS